jgi:hypothetical protein
MPFGGADIRTLRPALAGQAFQADAGRIFLHQSLSATTACSAAPARLHVAEGLPDRTHLRRRRRDAPADSR